MAEKQQIDFFTQADFDYVTVRVAQEPDRLILVGGQAVAVWGIYFDVPPPPGDYPVLTADTDWLGHQDDARQLCKSLESDTTTVEFQAEDAFGFSANTAMALMHHEERTLLMDFLKNITGLETKEVERLALEITISGNRFRVMHPLHCLISRFANLKAHSIKRLGNGPIQAKWMIEITRRYLESLVDSEQPPDEVAKAIRIIANLAAFDPGKYCYLNMKLDALDAIPRSAIIYAGEGFAGKEWPVIIARINKKRISWAAQT